MDGNFENNNSIPGEPLTSRNFENYEDPERQLSETKLDPSKKRYFHFTLEEAIATTQA